MNTTAETSSAPVVYGDKIEQRASVNPTPLVNRTHVREFLLEEARRTRAHKFTRVSEDTLIAVNAQVRQHLVSIVRQLPSKGQTI